MRRRTRRPPPLAARSLWMASIKRNVVRDVVGLEASTPCREAAKLMAQKRIGAVAVKQGGRIVGFVSERDLILRCLVGGGTCEAPIAEAMRSDLPSIDATASESECAILMELAEGERRVAAVPATVEKMVKLGIDVSPASEIDTLSLLHAQHYRAD